MKRNELFGVVKRIRNKRGLTLTEMLVTLLIMTLASTLLATGIPVAIDTYHKTVNSANAQMALSTTLTVLRSEVGMSTDVRLVDDNIYYLSEAGHWACISNAGESGHRGLVKSYFAGEPSTKDKHSVEGLSGTAIDNMTYPLVSDSLLQGTQPLKATYSSLSFSGSSPEDTSQLIITLKVTIDSNGDSSPLAEAKDYRVLLRFNKSTPEEE